MNLWAIENLSGIAGNGGVTETDLSAQKKYDYFLLLKKTKRVYFFCAINIPLWSYCNILELQLRLQPYCE